MGFEAPLISRLPRWGQPGSDTQYCLREAQRRHSRAGRGDGARRAAVNTTRPRATTTRPSRASTTRRARPQGRLTSLVELLPVACAGSVVHSYGNREPATRRTPRRTTRRYNKRRRGRERSGRALREPAHQGKAHVFGLWDGGPGGRTAGGATTLRCSRPTTRRRRPLVVSSTRQPGARACCRAWAQTRTRQPHARVLRGLGRRRGTCRAATTGGYLSRPAAPAAAGWRVGDELTALDGQPIPTDADAWAGRHGAAALRATVRRRARRGGRAARRRAARGAGAGAARGPSSTCWA